MNFLQDLDHLSWPEHFFIPPKACPNARWVDQALPLFPNLREALFNTPQDPVHHAEGDVWTHTQMVVDALLQHPIYAQLSPARAGIAFYAALLHDISKPETTQERDGHIIAPGHSRKGAVEVRRLFWEMQVPFELREMVCRLIEVHQVPFFAFESKKGETPEYIAIKLSQDRDLELLCLLAESDIRGRICQDQAHILADIELFREVAREQDCYQKSFEFPSSYTRMAYFQSRGQRYPHEAVYVEEKQQFEVVMLSGLPATGKNTWVEKYGQNRPVVSYDDMRESLNLKHGQNIGTVVHAVDDQMRDFLRHKTPFIINATHLSEQMRERTLQLLHDYHATIHIVYLEEPKSILLQRNRARNSSLSNTQLLRMAHRWEVPGWVEAHQVDHMVNLQSLKLKKHWKI